MATSKTLTTEAIALTEKKMDMTLEDIIKMSKKTTTKGKERLPRPPIKSKGFLNGRASGRDTLVQRVMDSRSYIRQGVLAQRRSNFRGTQFPVTMNIARKASVMPVRTMVRNQRSNFRGNQFPTASNITRNEAVMPIRSMVANRNKPRVPPPPVQRKAADGGSTRKDKTTLPEQRPQTMDALFANMKEQRMRVFSAQQQTARASNRQAPQRHRVQQPQQQRGGRGGAVPGRWFGNTAR